MRNVIAHYHTYKNSGSSFDELLTENFGDKHVVFDGPFPYTQFNQVELSKIIVRHTNAVAFSSHQIHLPVPSHLAFNVLAVAFLREPLLRIQSIYSYSKNLYAQVEDPQDITDPIVRWAGENDFDGWINQQRETGELFHVSNAQTHLFSGLYGGPGPAKLEHANTKNAFRRLDVEQAKRNVSTVPLLARTEHYEQDIAAFPKILASHGIDFLADKRPPTNVSTSHLDKSPEQRISLVKSELSDETLNWLGVANALDTELHRFASRLIHSRAH